jgi:hypothetical protein
VTDERAHHCYRVKLPSLIEARRILGIAAPTPAQVEERARLATKAGWNAAEFEDDDSKSRDAILCGALGQPCFHCGGVSEALCDFPLGDVGRTCDRALCLECAPTVDADKNYCRDHDEHGRKMLLFPQPKRVVSEPDPAPRRRAKPLPKAPPESHRWRVRQGRGDPGSHGAVLTGWQTEIEARRFAANIGGYVETWDQFVKLWRALYPLKQKPRKR